MHQPITIIDPNSVETLSLLGCVNWWVVGTCGALAAGGAMLLVLAAIRRRAKMSLGERAAAALAREMRLNTRTTKALWTVADQLGMRERAGVLLVSRAALLNAVARLATKDGDKKSNAAAKILVDHLVGTGA